MCSKACRRKITENYGLPQTENCSENAPELVPDRCKWQLQIDQLNTQLEAQAQKTLSLETEVCILRYKLQKLEGEYQSQEELLETANGTIAKLQQAFSEMHCRNDLLADELAILRQGGASTENMEFSDAATDTNVPEMNQASMDGAQHVINDPVPYASHRIAFQNEYERSYCTFYGSALDDGNSNLPCDFDYGNELEQFQDVYGSLTDVLKNSQNQHESQGDILID